MIVECRHYLHTCTYAFAGSWFARSQRSRITNLNSYYGLFGQYSKEFHSDITLTRSSEKCIEWCICFAFSYCDLPVWTEVGFKRSNMNKSNLWLFSRRLDMNYNFTETDYLYEVHEKNQCD